MLLSSCVNIFKLADLTPKDSPSNLQENLARTVLQAMGEAHGISNWEKIDTYSINFSDDWYGFVGKNAHPYKESNVKMKMDYVHGTYDGRMRFIDGKKKGEIWGLQSWHAYKVIDDEMTFKRDKNIEFFLPTYQYFIELPLRIQEATALSYVGSREVEGKSCEGVLASWNTLDPQKEIDQYLLWIDKETKMLVKVEYTIRDAYKFVSGSTLYQNYKDFNGLKLAMDMPVMSNLVKKDFLHRMRILEFEANKVPQAFIQPKKDIEISDRYTK